MYACIVIICIQGLIYADNKLPEGLKRLLQAYPDHLTKASKNSIFWNDGSEMIYDDGNSSKDYEILLDFPDLEDQMAMEYPVNYEFDGALIENFDPGRIRYEPFFKKIYGSSRGEVKKHLVPIKWLPGTMNKTLYVTSVNDVNKKLQAISDELDKLPPEYKKFLDNPAGTFKWRYIAGTKRLSPHSFGIAIDINVNHSSYWRWDLPEYKYKNQIPRQIVEIFEKYQFIWGGKWYHYDTMHFEYRPELFSAEVK